MVKSSICSVVGERSRETQYCYPMFLTCKLPTTTTATATITITRSYLSVFQRISLLRSLLKGDCMQGLTIFLGRISPFSSLAVSAGGWHWAVLAIVCN